MRITLTLDEDIAAKLQAETRRSGKSFRDVVNETMHHAFASQRSAVHRNAFEVTPRDLGKLRAGLSLNNIAELLEQIEGPLHR